MREADRCSGSSHLASVHVQLRAGSNSHRPTASVTDIGSLRAMARRLVFALMASDGDCSTTLSRRVPTRATVVGASLTTVYPATQAAGTLMQVLIRRSHRQALESRHGESWPYVFAVRRTVDSQLKRPHLRSQVRTDKDVFGVDRRHQHWQASDAVTSQVVQA